MSGGSGMVTFEVDGTGEDARRVSEAMRLFTLATSLGGVESLVSIPVLTSHAMISAEQRAKMEAVIKANSGEKTRTTTYKDCMTKEKLEKGVDFGKTDSKCPPTVVNSTASIIDARFSCEQLDVKTSGSIHFEALNPENIRGSGQTSATGGGNTMNVKLSWTGKWIGPACGGETE